jgi:hypothetical protein
MADARDLLLFSSENVWTRNEWFGGSGYFDMISKIPFGELLSLPPGQDKSIWQIAAHLCYYKHMLANMRGRKLGDFIYSGKDFPELPEQKSKENWKKFLKYMEYIQNEYMQVIRVIDDNLLSSEIEGWDKTWSQVFLFTYSHDIYHISQIRNGWHHLF